jgi:hypothetical protein
MEGKRKMTGKFFFKKSKVNGEEYLQVWRKLASGKSEYVDSIGNAKKAHKVLVELKSLREQTKNYEEILTKNFRGEQTGK